MPINTQEKNPSFPLIQNPNTNSSRHNPQIPKSNSKIKQQFLLKFLISYSTQKEKILSSFGNEALCFVSATTPRPPTSSWSSMDEGCHRYLIAWSVTTMSRSTVYNAKPNPSSRDISRHGQRCQRLRPSWTTKGEKANLHLSSYKQWSTPPLDFLMAVLPMIAGDLLLLPPIHDASRYISELLLV